MRYYLFDIDELKEKSSCPCLQKGLLTSSLPKLCTGKAAAVVTSPPQLSLPKLFFKDGCFKIKLRRGLTMEPDNTVVRLHFMEWYYTHFNQT